MRDRSELSRFARAALVAAVGRSPWLLVVFILGVIGLEILANFLYGLIVSPEAVTWAALLRGLVTLLILGGAGYVLFRVDRRRARKMGFSSRLHTETIDPHPGLIWLLSPERLDPLLIAMSHHAASDAPPESRLRHCWVVLSPHPRIEPTYADLSTEMERRGIRDVELHPVQLADTSIEQTYRAVSHIYEDELRSVELSASHVVTDLTGGLKTMTAGALLACFSRDWPIEYLVSERDEVDGAPVVGSQRPTLVDVRFFSAREV
jgi:hypothetical protein